MRRTTRSRVSAKLRPLFPSVDLLEARQLLSTAQAMQGPYANPAAGQVSAPLFQVGRFVSNTSPPAGALAPAQVAQAYGFSSISFGGAKGDGTGETIAIVDAYSDTSIQSDLNTFDTQYNLPSTTVTQVNETGGSTLPSGDSTGGWELEESLDVEWAHAMAPGAKILLVAASSPNDTDLLSAVSYAASHANVVSMSWGGGEFSGENSYDGDFSHAGVTFVASSGDNGAPIEWPAASPNVLAVGGTALTLSGNTYVSESGWSGSGGGPSAYESQPAYQSGVVTQTTTRANPDVSYDASPSTGFAVYDSVAYNGTSFGWIQIGGTSAGAPQWSALVAIADQGRALSTKPAIDATSAQELQTTLYSSSVRAADFHDITSGSSTGSPSYSAGPGYDFVTGIGTPIANLVVQSLDGTVAAPASDHLTVSAPASGVAGSTFNVTVSALTSGGTADAKYTGTIKLSSSDVQAGLPASYTFTAGDDGSHTFSVILKTAGSQTVTATDTTGTAGTATSSGIAVTPAAASKIALSGLASTDTAGTPSTFTVTAYDPYGNVATGYTGTVVFSSSDAAASLPASYTFTTSNAGTRSFSLTFATAGTQSVTVKDSGNASLSATQSGIAVSPAAPINLAASAVSTSQINLTWTGSAGATGYTIQRLSGTTWNTIGTTASGVTSYSDTGLTAGSTYSYRVQATGGPGSAYSNSASATTSGTVTASSDTIWSNSYVPSENAYSSGSYEVGVKFESSVAGTVTGARFYKQTWMGGYTHIGHLWSSSGTLLATATFTNETSYGWQQVNFSSPVAIAANTVYIVSFSTGGGYFGITTTGLSSSGVTTGPLTALSNTAAGGNGVYRSGTGVFPTVSGGGMNFWADVAFSPTASPAVAAGVTRTSGPADFFYIAPGSSNLTSPAVTSGAGSSQTNGTTATADLAGTTVVSRAVPQATTLAAFRRKGGLAFDPSGF